jgi:uncharacterized protein with beta-barrel porin domain
LKIDTGGMLALGLGGVIVTTNFDASTGTFNFTGDALTVNGGTYTSAGTLAVEGNNSPQFVLTNGAIASGVSAVVVETQSSGLSILNGATLSQSGTATSAAARSPSAAEPTRKRPDRWPLTAPTFPHWCWPAARR